MLVNSRYFLLGSLAVLPSMASPIAKDSPVTGELDKRIGPNGFALALFGGSTL